MRIEWAKSLLEGAQSSWEEALVLHKLPEDVSKAAGVQGAKYAGLK